MFRIIKEIDSGWEIPGDQFKQFKTNAMKLMERKLIYKREDKISWLQIIGFFLMVLGIMYLLVNLFWFDVNTNDISINFFIIMLGFAFAFPDLLKDENKGLSTMRLVVFMMVSVICMLLLKIGWDSESLKEINMDQYWMGIIAFVFGAKAVQTFFESRFATTEASNNNATADTATGSYTIDTKFSTLSKDDQRQLIRAAINENYDVWKAQYPNITGCTAGNKRVDNQLIAQQSIVFFVSDKVTDNDLSASETIPKRILYGGVWIPTDVIEQEVAKAHAKIRFPGDGFQPPRIGTNVSRHILENFYGTVGLKVKRTFTDGRLPEFFLLSCFHVLYNDKIDKAVLTAGKKIEVLSTDESNETRVTIPGILCCREKLPPRLTRLNAFVKEGIMSKAMDAALVKIENEDALENETFSFEDGQKSKTQKVSGELKLDDAHTGMTVFGYGCISGRRKSTVTLAVCEKTEVEIKTSTQMFIHTFNRLIQTGPISDSGDSGGPVLTEDGKVVGIIVAGNGINSYVLPFQFIKNELLVTV